MSFFVTVLGSSGMYATVERACAGYLVEVDGRRLWMDAGAGTWRNLLQHVSFENLDGVLLSHRHSDHVTDVFQAFHARYYRPPEPLEPIPLWAPEETLERVTGFYPDIAKAFNLHTIEAGGAIDFSGARLSFVEMAHPCETVGARIEGGRSVLAYSSDTGPAADIATLARAADVFLCEATLQDQDEDWGGHMKASQAGAAAASAEVSKLVLTHLPPGRDHGLSLVEAHKTAGGVEVQLASDSMRLEVGG